MVNMICGRGGAQSAVPRKPEPFKSSGSCGLMGQLDGIGKIYENHVELKIRSLNALKKKKTFGISDVKQRTYKTSLITLLPGKKEFLIIYRDFIQ